jgi:hypothetical protein
MIMTKAAVNNFVVAVPPLSTAIRTANYLGISAIIKVNHQLGSQVTLTLTSKGS